MAMDRSSTKTWTLAAQSLLGASVLGLGGAAFLTLPQATTGPDGPVELPAAPVTSDGVNQPATPRGDGIGTAARLARVSNRPAEPVAAPVDVAPVEVAPVVTGPSISYLGSVTIGTSRRGLIRLDGKQKFVALKDKVAEREVEQIEEAFIMIGGQRYELPARSGSALSTAVAPTPAPAAAASPHIVKALAQGAQFARAGFGAGAADQAIVFDGFLRVPDYVQREDAALWRRIRAELIESEKYDPRDVGRIASKFLEERRNNTKEEDIILTDEQLQRERKFFEEHGDPDATPQIKGLPK